MSVCVDVCSVYLSVCMCIGVWCVRGLQCAAAPDHGPNVCLITLHSFQRVGHVSSFCHTAKTTTTTAGGVEEAGEERQQHRSLFVCACQTAAGRQQQQQQQHPDRARQQHGATRQQHRQQRRRLQSTTGWSKKKKTVAEINVANLQVLPRPQTHRRCSMLPPSLSPSDHSRLVARPFCF